MFIKLTEDIIQCKYSALMHLRHYINTEEHTWKVAVCILLFFKRNIRSMFVKHISISMFIKKHMHKGLKDGEHF